MGDRQHDDQAVDHAPHELRDQARCAVRTECEIDRSGDNRAVGLQYGSRVFSASAEAHSPTGSHYRQENPGGYPELGIGNSTL